jgi:hypothetical protein
MTSDRCWHLRAHRRPRDAGSRPIIIIRSIVIIAVSTIMIAAAISSSTTTTSNGTSGGSSGARRGGGADRDGDSGDLPPGHGQSAALFCVRDRYRMAETEVSVPLAFTGNPQCSAHGIGD